MSRRARRIIIPLVVGLAVLGILIVMYQGQNRRAAQRSVSTASNQTSATQPATGPATTGQAATAPFDQSNQAQTQPAIALTGLHAVAPPGDMSPRDQLPQALGSLDYRKHVMRVELSRWGAGIAKIEYSDIWETAADKLKAHEYFKTLRGPDDPIDFQQIANLDRYELITRNPRVTGARLVDTPVMAASAVVINGYSVPLIHESAWAETAVGTFESHIVDESGTPIARITRRYALGPAYDLELHQSVQNLTSQPLEIAWQQNGPLDLAEDRAGYIDRRRFHFGYLPIPQRDPTLVKSNDDDYVFERTTALSQAQDAREETTAARRRDAATFWPSADARQRGWELAWFASTNRYFGLAIHPPVQDHKPATHSLQPTVSRIEVGESAGELVYTTLTSDAVNVAPGATHAFDIGVFAGPLDLDVLNSNPYDALAMSGMVVYSMSGCCTFLTFQWLADFLFRFLKFLHDYVVFDWGIAIMLLVVVVRTLLHPLTKKSQVNMQRFGKRMAAMKPEIDKIQKKYASDPKRAQQEQLRLMREHGVNPLQMLGCLPMFLQMPIWIALWAMLYLAFDIRQEPAFYGVFQLLNNWQFLADLSSPDNFWILPGGGFTIPWVGWRITSLNVLPLLMGLVFFFQQKYMSPPPTPNMTPEQLQQQRIMKVMMVVLFPLMLYKAPSGLTLYILTSSCIGILESRYIRQHVTELELNPPKPADPASKKPKDRLARLWAEKLEAARAKRAQQQQGQRSFKKRK